MLRFKSTLKNPCRIHNHNLVLEKFRKRLIVLDGRCLAALPEGRGGVGALGCEGQGQGKGAGGGCHSEGRGCGLKGNQSDQLIQAKGKKKEKTREREREIAGSRERERERGRGWEEMCVVEMICDSMVTKATVLTQLTMVVARETGARNIYIHT